MPIDSGNLALKGLDELFTTEEKRQEEQREQVQQIPIDELHPFTNHPFKVVDDEAMTRTVESIAQFGVLAPLIARPRPDGDGYEIISGHRRQFAAKMAGLETLPVIVRDMDDDAATILMVDSNLQREHISPSERAFAYKMKMDAMKRTAGRPPKENPRQVVGNLETADLIGKESGESGRQVQRFIRLTNLILSIVIFVIVYGRMIEIYCMVSLAPIPMATWGNHEQSHMGQNYLKCLFALGFQGFLILICVAIYAVLIQNVAISGDAINSIWGIVGYTVLLCFSLFKTSSVTKSVLGAH